MPRMAGSTFGKLFRVTTAGVSHGPGYLCIIDGCPAGLEFDEELIRRDLARRRVGQSKVTSQRQEEDEFQVLSGVFDGRTTEVRVTLAARSAATS